MMGKKSDGSMRHIVFCLLSLFLTLNLAGCGGGSTASETTNEPGQELEQTPEQEPERTMNQTEYLEAVPPSYFDAAAGRGSVIAETYRSHDYTSSNNEAIAKTAYVYLPYGYDAADKDKRYDILYLMHGWTMTAGDFFDDPRDGSHIVAILDNLIQNGDIPPIIVVCATFDAVNQSQSFSRSTEELSVFHRDFRDDLVPYIEGKYNTYADNVTEEGLRRSRGHRAFGGFSLGAVTTWYQFIYNLDYVKYFLPMSGDCWILGTYGGLYYPVETTEYLAKVVSDGGWAEEDFLIYEGIGTADSRWAQTDNQIEAMIRNSTFTPKNLHYAIIEGGRHDLHACERYLYHALQMFFKN